MMSPRLAACRTSSTWLCAPSFCMRLARCRVAVCGEMPSRSATSFVVRPRAMSCSTSRSRAVSGAGRAVAAARRDRSMAAAT
jgi:hypothetical protein